ncbi:hypothetical protein [Actinosynnema sp. ALI-1.44]|uniref:hypothetical protein n=1 Tax=Actinosynnema sp. ALI-1.44 TaxID=1933779 RepID=UPI001EDB7E39|nr:hypothetical protein [Actinosynnema sp. ALI-1.44]
MTASIIERDQDTGATSTRYHYTRVVEIAGRIVRARLERGVYLNHSGAVAEMLTDQTGLGQPRRRRPQQLVVRHPPSVDIDAAAVLGPLAERLLHRAAEILAAPPPTVTLSPHLYRAVSALLATSSGYKAECRIDPNDITWATDNGGTLHIFEHPDGGVTFTKAHRDECPFLADKGGQDCDDECYFDLPSRI